MWLEQAVEALGTRFAEAGYTIPDKAVYCNAVAPEICAPCRYWYSNDGDGLDSAGAVALADVLEAEIKATYAALEHPQREPAPGDIFAEAPRDPNPFVENVDSFAVFLRRSAGFEIW